MITHEPTPARSLDTSGSSVEFLLEGVNAAKGFLNGILERSSREGSAVSFALRVSGSKVLPEERVVDVS